MSETRIWMTAVFNDPHQAERYADCLGALQQADQSRHAQLNRELGLKPLLAGELEDVPVDSLTLFGAGVEVWLTTPPGASPQTAHFRDLHRLGCQLAICETFDDQDASTALAVYIEGRKAPRKAILEILPGLAPELQLLLAARLAPARVEGIIKQLGGPDATVMGKPLVFRLTRLLPAADPLLLRALEQADLNCCDPATGRSLLHGFLAPGSIHRDMVNTLFQAGFDPACDLQGNLLLEAARLGDCYAVMALLRSGRVDANATDEQGMNCLHHLCREPWVEQRDAVREAIDHGVELSRPSVLGTPLWLALKHSPRVVPMLREAGAISAPGPDSYSGNPVDDLLVAIEHEDAARFAERVAQCSEETVLYQAAVIAACHLRDGFLQTLLSRITEARPGLATQVEGQLLFNRIWQPPVDASRAAAVSWLLLESGGLHDLDLSALNFGPFVLHDAKTALTFIQAIVAAGGRVADARVLLNAPQARQLAEQLPTLDRYLASLMELGLDVRHLIRLVEDEPAREALLLRSAQLGHSIEAIGRIITQCFVTDNARLLEILLGSRLQRPEVQQEIWLHLLYAPPYGAWQRFDPGQKFLAPLVDAGLDINFPVQVFDSRMASTPLQLARQFDQTRTISYLEKLGAAETLPGTPA